MTEELLEGKILLLKDPCYNKFRSSPPPTIAFVQPFSPQQKIQQSVLKL